MGGHIRSPIGNPIGSPIGSHVGPEWVGSRVRKPEGGNEENPSVADSRTANDYQYRRCRAVTISIDL
ncbi:hypothetical protein [Azospirillum largimobile]